LKNSESLLKVLCCQYEACRQYLEIQNRKTEVLVIGDIKKLDEIVLNEQLYIMKMESFDRKRENILAQEELFGVSISDIINKYTEEEYVSAYREIFAKLNDITSELKKVNQLNQRILRERLSVIYRLNGKLAGGRNV